MTMLFITGMFRSGTTTLARALNAHPMMAIAADPFTEVLKALRSEEAATLGLSVPVMAPLGNYYFEPEGLLLLDQLLNRTTLDCEFTIWDREHLLEILAPRCEAYSGSLVPLLKMMDGSTYRELLDSLLNLVCEAYGNSQTKVVGFKEVWTNEFIPALARTYPNARFLTVCRDPRAVCASKNIREDRYPWTFMSIQWRKLTAMDYMFRHDPILKGRIYSMRYEDYITEPEKTTREICEFLEIDWHPNIADHTSYKDGNGNPWVQNTAYGKGAVSFDTTALERWRHTLSKREIELIEMMCGPEMELRGYERVYTPVAPAGGMLLNPPCIKDEEQAAWMRGIIPNNPASITTELAHETIRQALIEIDDAHRANVLEEVVKSAFLDRQILDAIINGNSKKAKG